MAKFPPKAPVNALNPKAFGMPKPKPMPMKKPGK